MTTIVTLNDGPARVVHKHSRRPRPIRPRFRNNAPTAVPESLPPSPDLIHLRQQLANAIEEAIAFLDALDGDAALEGSLGWTDDEAARDVAVLESSVDLEEQSDDEGVS